MKKFSRVSFTVIIGIFFISIFSNEVTAAVQPIDPIQAEIDTMSLEQKVGQLFMVPIRARFYNEQNPGFQQIKRWITKYHIGGISVYGGDAYAAARNIARFQMLSDRPLLVASTMEWGIPMRIAGGTRFPENMALGATRKPDFAYQEGVITAREMRALGFHINFAPVMDVNNNPDNPIINVRSYGENPQMVADFGTQFIRGLQSEHIAATAKHYPGHGDTSTDSHLTLPYVDVSRARLDSVEIPPFKAAIDAGVKVVMTSHIALPQLPSKNVPATLSPYLLRHLLRGSYGFQGVIVSDALNMGGIVNGYWPGESAWKAVRAGVDILLLSPDLDIAFQSVIDAVHDGRISEQQINDAIYRILALKKFVRVEENRFPDFSVINDVVGDTTFNSQAEEAFTESITLVKDENTALPLDPGKIDQTAVVIVTDDMKYGFPGSRFIQEISQRIDHPRIIRISPETSPEMLEQLAEFLPRLDAVILGVFVRFRDHKGSIGLPREQSKLLTALLSLDKPMVTVGFGTPYLLRYFPDAKTYLTTYSTSNEAQSAVVRSIFGEEAITGKLPVTLPSGYQFGDGLERNIYSNVWKEQQTPERFQDVIDIVNQGIADSVAPGIAVYIAREGKVLLSKGFGRYKYDKSSRPVTRHSIFDLASLTKVCATTPLAMQMYQQNLLHLNEPVSRYLPAFSGGIKDSVTIFNLLTHSSGLLPWKRFWLELDDSSKVFEEIERSDLMYTPGDSVVYSDLGIILLGHILEKLGQEPLNILTRNRLYQPLAMEHTTYLPSPEWKENIVPTIYDLDIRGTLLQGDVHDPNAAFLGGVSGHAGLFSTIDDLGRYAQMLLSKGYYDRKKYFRQGTIQLFTTRKIKTRALGWDTADSTGGWYGKYLSPRAFVHTGYTGTSIVVDPEYNIIIILLTNRVYPDGGNGGSTIFDFRPKFHNTVMEDLLTPEEISNTQNLWEQLRIRQHSDSKFRMGQRGRQ